MAAASNRPKRHHFVPAFYLKNFAEFDGGYQVRAFFKNCGWKRTNVTKVGCETHLYTLGRSIDQQDYSVEHFLERIDNPRKSGLEGLSRNPSALSDEQREAIASFLAFMTMRSPSTVDSVIRKYNMQPKKAIDEAYVRETCRDAGLDYSRDIHNDVMRREYFHKALSWCACQRKRLLGGHWIVFCTTRQKPFITSDWPTYGMRDELRGPWVVSFPVSSEVALMITCGARGFEIRQATDGEVVDINRRTMAGAERFVVCHQESFPGDDALAQW
ncbi:MAG: DUF4238 domain-containing protein [Planctomycetota bacterium]|jgi:hypothetical protein